MFAQTSIIPRLATVLVLTLPAALHFGEFEVLGAAPPQPDQPKSPAMSPPDGQGFGLTKVWQVHLAMSAQEYEAMEPTGIEGMALPLPPEADRSTGNRPTGTGRRDVHRSHDGAEFPWVQAALTADGVLYPKVAVRYKGHATYQLSAHSLKRSLKLDLNRFDRNAAGPHGLKMIVLNSGVTDSTKGREALAYRVFRAAGVPASRTAFAEVSLTVPGKFDREYLGLYTLVEDVDKSFFKARFPDGRGLLLKPERLHGLEYLGEDWHRYETQYRPKRTPTPEEARRVIAFVRFVNQADDDQFRQEIDAYLEVEMFLRYLAVNALLANLDSFLADKHNYCLYLNPGTNRFVFVPWDLDLALAGWTFGGMPEQQMDLSLNHPHAGDNKLIDRLLAIPEVKAKYQGLLREFAAGCFSKERLIQDVEAIEEITRPRIAKEVAASVRRKEGRPIYKLVGVSPAWYAQKPDLRTFVEKRTESVLAQLAGQRDGYIPPRLTPGVGVPGSRGDGQKTASHDINPWLRRAIFVAVYLVGAAAVIYLVRRLRAKAATRNESTAIDRRLFKAGDKAGKSDSAHTR